MKKTVFDEQARQSILVRLSRFTPDAKQKWGSMTPEETLRHLRDLLLNALGEYPAKSAKSFLSSWLGKNLLIYVFPWPKSPPTAPEFDAKKLTTPPLAFEEGMKSLLDALNRFVQSDSSFSFSIHPSFGALSRKQWGYLMYKHFNHHLSQFGL